MQPPHNPYEQQGQQPQPQQNPYQQGPYQQQNPYQQAPQGYQQPQGQYPRPQYGQVRQGATALDIITGVLLLLVSLGYMLIGGLMALLSGAMADQFSRMPGLGNLGTGAVGILAGVGIVIFLWNLVMFICAIGMFSAKRGAHLTAAIMATIGSLGLLFGLYGIITNPGGSNAGGIILFLFVLVTYLLTVFNGYARSAALGRSGY